MRDAPEMDLPKLLASDSRAWDECVQRFTPVVYAAVSKTLRTYKGGADPDDTGELVQNVFIRLIRNEYRLLKSYDRRKASPVTWLTIIARSVTIDFVRKRRLDTVPLEDQLDEAVAPDAPKPEPALAFPDDLLSPRQELVLRLTYEKDLTVPEIAESLQINEQTVRSTKHKGLTKLRKQFQAQSGEP